MNQEMDNLHIPLTEESSTCHDHVDSLEKGEQVSATSFRQVMRAVPVADPRPRSTYKEDDGLDDRIRNIMSFFLREKGFTWSRHRSRSRDRRPSRCSRSSTCCSPRQLKQLLGLLNFLAPYISLGHLHMHPLQIWPAAHWDHSRASLDTPIQVNEKVSQSLVPWMESLIT